MFSALVAGQALAIQLARELAKTGTKSELGHFMVISSVRALGPVLTGIVVASRMSAGITAELGAMKSSEQIDALVAFGTDPMKRLVAPRMIGLWIALPVLTVIGDTLSVIGGGFVGLGYHITLESYYNGVAKYLTPSNLLVGMIKPVFFAVLITTVACWKGLTSAGGAPTPHTSTAAATTKSRAASKNRKLSAPCHFGSESGKCIPISPRAAAPSSASVIACDSTSASECPARPNSQGIATPPKINGRPGSIL